MLEGCGKFQLINFDIVWSFCAKSLPLMYLVNREMCIAFFLNHKDATVCLSYSYKKGET